MKIEITKEEKQKEFTLIIDGVTITVSPNFNRIMRDVKDHKEKRIHG